MGVNARIRINEHRLVREPSSPVHDVRVNDRRATVDAYTAARRTSLQKRGMIHLVVFGLAFVFTTGFAVLSILMWVRPDSLASLVFVGVFAGCVFVASFAVLRFLSLVHLFPDTHGMDSGEEEHHLAKSIAYGFVALVFALLLAGVLINTATAVTL